MPGWTGVPTRKVKSVAELLYPLALLACPIGMGLMMFFMMRGNKNEPPHPPAAADELTQLRAEVDQLRAGQPNPVPPESSAGLEARERR